MDILLTIVISYFIGNFSSAYFIGKVFKKVDIRELGSGNSGATNAVRVMGKRYGVLTFLLDFTKGIIAVLIGQLIMGYNGGLIAAIFVVIGHDWPVILGFKGGKGISTTIGCYAVLNFPIALLAVILGILTGVISKFVSLGSIIFLISMPILYFVLSKNLEIGFFIVTVIFAIIGLYKHRGNIKRLLNGEERKIGG